MVVDTKNLAAALVAAQRSASAVPKDSKNEFHRYMYASAEDVITEARGALAGAGLSFSAVDHAIVAGLSKATIKDVGSVDIHDLHVTYQLLHESGESMVVKSVTPIVPEKGRPIDKAVGAAKTFDLSYTLRSLLLLPRGEDQPDKRDDRGYKPGSEDDRRTVKRDEPSAKPVPDARVEPEPGPLRWVDTSAEIAPTPADFSWVKTEIAAILGSENQATLKMIEAGATPKKGATPAKQKAALVNAWGLLDRLRWEKDAQAGAFPVDEPPVETVLPVEREPGSDG